MCDHATSVMNPHNLILGGFEKGSLNECYYIASQKTGVSSIIQDNTEMQGLLLSYLDKNLHVIPYGFPDKKSLIPYFLQPHSYLFDLEGNAYIFFKQAPYFRKIYKDGRSVFLGFVANLDDAYIYPSTAHMSSDGHTITLARNKLCDRIEKYNQKRTTLDYEILRYDTRQDRFTILTTIRNSLLDTIHQVSVSPLGAIVCVDMNLEPERAAYETIYADNGAWSKENIKTYAAFHFPCSQISVSCPQRGDEYSLSICRPQSQTAAHIEWGHTPNEFFVSCHNMSKYQTNIIIHGPGEIEKYRIEGKTVRKIASYTAPNFYRITSFQALLLGNRPALVTTVYPNKLLFLDQQDMSVIKEVILFDAQDFKTPFICPKETESVLFLSVDSQNGLIHASGGKNIYTIRLDDFCLINTTHIEDNRQTVITAHINPLTAC